jgi:hypothetical protein
MVRRKPLPLSRMVGAETLPDTRPPALRRQPLPAAPVRGASSLV